MTLIIILSLAPAFPLPGSSDSTAAKVPQSALALQVSAASVPPGAVAQIRVALAVPHQIASGQLVMDLDPSVFGPVAAVDVFSATGDQMGVANIRDRHVDAQFSSPSGGIGRLPKMPAIVVTVPVLASAKAGDTSSIAVATADAPWKDVQGNQYVPTAQPAQMKVGGSLSIDSVTPGGGLLPAGTTVRIDGRGFAPSTAVEIEGVVVRSTGFVGPQTILLTLGALADLTGKRVVARNPDGTQADFYSALRGKLRSTGQEFAFLWPIFPLRTYVAASGRPMVQNPNTEPVELTYEVISRIGIQNFSRRQVARLDPGEIAAYPYIAAPGIQGRTLYSTLPVRMLELSFRGPGTWSGSIQEGFSHSLLNHAQVKYRLGRWEAILLDRSV